MSDRVRIKGQYTAIPNELLRSNRLSLEAKGMLFLIASHSDGWKFRQSDMLKKAGCSKDKYYRIINDLKEKGYLDIVPGEKIGGRFSGSEWVVDFSPVPENQEASPVPEKPDTENQDTKKTNKRNTPLTPQGGDGRVFGVSENVKKILEGME